MLTLLALILAAQQVPPRTDVVTPPGGQVGRTGAADVSLSQVTAARDATSVEQLPADPAAPRAVVQVAPEQARQGPQPQITRERRGAGGAPQLAHGGRSAAAPASPATRADGRRTEVVRVGGSDRCDPQAGARDAGCQRVIETRSAEYGAPRAPTLSPEQRLLLDQERGEMRSVRAAAARVARNEVDPDALDTQALAAISLTRPAEATPPTAADTGLPSGTDAALIQVIEAVQAGLPKF